MTTKNPNQGDFAPDPSSYLFVPANRPDRFQKAADSGAHRIIIDLEDAVAPAEKDGARSAVEAWLKSGKSAVVRTNCYGSFWFDADLAALAPHSGVEVMLPKADEASMRLVLDYLVDSPVIALIETVSGLMQVNEITKMKGVSRLAFGNMDFSADARISPMSVALDHARFQIAMASRNGGLPAPIDGVTTDLNDERALAGDVERARAFGFDAKLCIHPRQVAVVNSRFGPRADEIAWAKSVIIAVEAAGENVIQFEGKMIDKPVVDQARAIVARALTVS